MTPVKTYIKAFNPSIGSVDKVYIKHTDSDRIAKCSCGLTSLSHASLPFFKRGKKIDKYYCGHEGWD